MQPAGRRACETAVHAEPGRVGCEKFGPDKAFADVTATTIARAPEPGRRGCVLYYGVAPVCSTGVDYCTVGSISRYFLFTVQSSCVPFPFFLAIQVPALLSLHSSFATAETGDVATRTRRVPRGRLVEVVRERCAVFTVAPADCVRLSRDFHG